MVTLSLLNLLWVLLATFRNMCVLILVYAYLLVNRMICIGLGLLLSQEKNTLYKSISA